ncbi:MAG: hypothetical protein GWO07_04725 [Candidatus Dadabacteria bacterium]|nr:hypothetical protein [Candidatus Dadabacteria bacterium]NIS08065.1 hypothetical protein [Candidatus Dadabacteria bacterium]NIV42313.1 hypothetical protein [Candidatus Dadabacteria bacterium]NIX14808.1 hypothetical protein [Candidatus Dadabacteria bacterium]NIY21349.1 hypothetical protein [Candidatus Dadabacteria bacterium]
MTENGFNRNKAVEDGHQVDISEHVKNAGLLIPAYVTKQLWHEVIKLDTTTSELNIEEDKRIKEVISRLVYYIRTHRQSSKSNTIYFNVEFNWEGEQQTFDLVSHLGVIDDENSDPCITLFMSGEGQKQ